MPSNIHESYRARETEREPIDLTVPQDAKDELRAQLAKYLDGAELAEAVRIGTRRLWIDPSNGVLCAELPKGNTARGKYGLATLARQLAERARMLSFGEDPQAMLAKLLVKRGVPADEADERAQGRAWREPNGDIAVRLAGSGSGAYDPVTGQATGAQTMRGEAWLATAADMIARESAREREQPAADRLAEKRAEGGYNF